MRHLLVVPLALLALASTARAAPRGGDSPAAPPVAKVAAAPIRAPLGAPPRAVRAQPAPLPSAPHVPPTAPRPQTHGASPAGGGVATSTVPPSFPAARVAVSDAAGVRALLAGAYAPGHAQPPVTRAMRDLADHVHFLMPGGPDAYERAVVTPTHVALVRKSGIIDLVSHADARAQIESGQPLTRQRVDVGVGPKGFPMFAEAGPNGTVRLYRQLPRAAHGEIWATDGLTSFALTEDDAFHPWGEAGHTVAITIPRALLDRVGTGELGGTGWLGKGGVGIDVIQEVQIDTATLKSYLAGTWR